MHSLRLSITLLWLQFRCHSNLANFLQKQHRLKLHKWFSPGFWFAPLHLSFLQTSFYLEASSEWIIQTQTPILFSPGSRLGIMKSHLSWFSAKLPQLWLYRLLRSSLRWAFPAALPWRLVLHWWWAADRPPWRKWCGRPQSRKPLTSKPMCTSQVAGWIHNIYDVS